MRRLTLMFLGFTFWLTSCGYQLGAPSSSLKKSINEAGGVLVKVTKNQTLNRDLEPLLLRQMGSSLEEQGVQTNSVVGKYMLAVELQSINYQALRSTDNNVLTASEYAIKIQARWVVMENGNSKLVGISQGESTFFAGLTEQSLDQTTVQNSNFVQASKHSYPQAILDLTQDIATKLAIGF